MGYAAVPFLTTAPAAMVAVARLLIAALGLAGGRAASQVCAQLPDLANLIPDTGSAQTLVRIAGANLRKARVVWDAGEPGERLLISNLQGADMFSVPIGSQIGDHWVAIQSEHGRSRRIKFTVVNSHRAKPKPRLDDISLLNTKFEAGGRVRVVLYVQGANIDVGANVFIDDVPQPSEAHKVLINKLFVSNPEVLEYPIGHYLSKVALIESQPGKRIQVRIVNEDGQLSELRSYSLPDNLAQLDSDGDGIPDVVELGLAYHNEAIDVRALGADRFRKDVFVELDVMKNHLNPPSPEVLEYERQMFAAAPFISPFGANGINLHIDATGTVEYWNVLSPSQDPLKWTCAIPNSHDIVNDKASFNVLIDKYLTPARRGLFHYAIWGAESEFGVDGYSRANPDTDVGSAFYVTPDGHPFQTLASQAAAFVHELGHNLGQRHGGASHSNERSPNYWGVMSYTWSSRTIKSAEYRRTHPTCTQMYYASPGTVEKDGVLPTHLGILLDYSEGMGPVNLVGNRGELDENVGVCGQPVDWNLNGIFGERGVNTPTPWCEPTTDGCSPYGPVSDYSNWANLKFDGPSGGFPRVVLPDDGRDRQTIQSDASLRKKLE